MQTPCSNLHKCMFALTHTTTQTMNPATTRQALCHHTDSRMTAFTLDHFHNKITTSGTETKPPSTGIPPATAAYYQVVKIV